MSEENRVKQAGLLDYLKTRRWFGEKGRDDLSAEIADVIPVTWPMSDERFLVARARVVGGGETVFYQLFLRHGDDRFTDAVEDDAFRRGLIEAFAAGSDFEHAGTHWVVQSEGEAPFKVPADATIRVSKAEQSNTSIFVGTQAVLKLFRKVAPGIHPDIEVTRFLTIDRRFLHTPALMGAIHFADEQGVWAAGMLQELVPGAKDGWTHALESTKEWFEGKSAEIPFTGEAERLGEITRSMHETLASGDHGSGFECQEASEEDLARWTEATVRMMRRALKSAGQESRLESLEAMVRGLAESVSADAGAKIRIHGDYHLGQVLRSVTDDFLIVDFEGEPSRPLEERRRAHSPLRDVAGMLRSFAYAAAVGSRQGETASRLSSHAERWERAVREAFLSGYLRAHSGQPSRDQNPVGRSSPRAILPRERQNVDNLIALFEAEKAFYELQYEVDHRPDWRWIPEAAIERLGGSREGGPGGR